LPAQMHPFAPAPPENITPKLHQHQQLKLTLDFLFYRFHLSLQASNTTPWQNVARNGITKLCVRNSSPSFRLIKYFTHTEHILFPYGSPIFSQAMLELLQSFYAQKYFLKASIGMRNVLHCLKPECRTQRELH
jgi:hypothetical protein